MRDLEGRNNRGSDPFTPAWIGLGGEKDSRCRNLRRIYGYSVAVKSIKNAENFRSEERLSKRNSAYVNSVKSHGQDRYIILDSVRGLLIMNER